MKFSLLLSGITPHSCVETRGSRVVATVGQTSQAAQSPRLGTSNARARANVEAGRSLSKLDRKAQVSRAKVVPVGRNRIRVADSLGTATSVAR